MEKKGTGQLYYKLFYTYTAVIVIIVLSLMVYFISATRQRILNMNLEYINLLAENGTVYLQESLDAANVIHKELYQSQSVLQDSLHYLTDSEEDYRRYRLDTFVNSLSYHYIGIREFVNKTFGAYPNLTKIELISYVRKEITTYYPDGTSRRQKAETDLLHSEAEGNRDPFGQFSFQKDIRDPDNLQTTGSIHFVFQAEKFRTIQNTFPQANLLLLNAAGKILYATEEKYILAQTADAELLSEYYNVKSSVMNYQLYAYLDKEDAAPVPLSVQLTIIGIGIGLMAFGGICVHIYLNRLNGRLIYILDGMNQITTGDLSVRLKSNEEGDELDVISENFNEMCEKLDRYIQKSYLAEIEQKNAEMEVLQNQINPHFLYNTLEAIRMKAICNGDREVGKMLYSMAVIFRSQLKDSNVITLIEEIHYCKKYMELFEFRYQGLFTYSIEYEEEIINVPCMKFILQPLLENYFVHGIRAEQAGNMISIKASKEDTMLIIRITDNGRGMSRELLDQKNRELTENVMDSHKSIGLSNVNRRLKAYYGSEYGITLRQNGTGGLQVVLRAGIGEELCEK